MLKISYSYRNNTFDTKLLKYTRLIRFFDNFLGKSHPKISQEELVYRKEERPKTKLIGIERVYQNIIDKFIKFTEI